ncbi:putative reverse transcriptase domain-containing protein [Tanacetum coccineum]
MRQRRGSELLSDYDCGDQNHPGVVGNVGCRCMSRKKDSSRDEKTFEQRADGEIYFFDRIWIPSIGDVRKLIMDEAHTSRYSVHPGADKMYYDLRDLYWWPGMEERTLLNVMVGFTSHFMASSSESIGYKTRQSTAYTLRPTVSVAYYIQKLVDMLRACVWDFGGSWDTHFPLIEFLIITMFKYLWMRSKIDEIFVLVDEPLENRERDVKKLKRRRIPLVKVRWNSRQVLS